MQSDRINWENLKYFLHAADAGSALGAARKLKVNHSTVARHVQALEQELGVQLFNRVKQGYQLTVVGEQVYAASNALRDQVGELARNAQRASLKQAGEITVSYPGNGLLDFSNLFGDFCRQHPDVSLQIRCSTENADLEHSQAQVALRLTDTPPAALVGKELARVQFSVFAHPDYLLANAAALQSPQHCDWILWSGSAHSQNPVVNHPDKLIAQKLSGIRVALSSDSMEDVLAGVCAGLGVGILSEQHGELHSELVRLPFDEFLDEIGVASVSLWVLAQQDVRHNPLLRLFYDFIKTRYSN